MVVPGSLSADRLSHEVAADTGAIETQTAAHTVTSANVTSFMGSLLPRLDNHRVVFAGQRATVEIAVDLKTGKSGGPQ